MKYLIYFLTLYCCYAAPRIEFEWGPSPDLDITNYSLYWGPSPGNYTSSIRLGNVTNTIFTNLVLGARYYFAVTASNASGLESDPSNELNFLVPSKPLPPKEFRIKQILQTTATFNGGEWKELGTLQSVIQDTGSNQFFRVVLQVEPPLP